VGEWPIINNRIKEIRFEKGGFEELKIGINLWFVLFNSQEIL